jgi:hypothetical protein
MLYFVKEKKFGIAEKVHYRVIASDRRERSLPAGRQAISKKGLLRHFVPRNDSFSAISI